MPPNTPIVFTDQSTGGTSIVWNFGDPASGSDNTSVLPAPAHAYFKPEKYCIRLVVSSSDGCTDTVSKCMEVVDGVIEIPNVFTPNEDNQNDEFYINNLKFGVADLKIYNRWGNLIFSSPAYNNDWNGQGVVDGVYYYVMNYPVDEKIYTGFVQLIKSK